MCYPSRKRKNYFKVRAESLEVLRPGTQAGVTGVKARALSAEVGTADSETQLQATEDGSQASKPNGICPLDFELV